MGTTGCPKGPNWRARAMHPPVYSLITQRDPVEHARRRKPWNRAFNSTALKEYEPIVTRRASQLLEGVASKKGVLDLAQWISFFTYDFMGDMACVVNFYPFGPRNAAHPFRLLLPFLR